MRGCPKAYIDAGLRGGVLGAQGGWGGGPAGLHIVQVATTSRHREIDSLSHGEVTAVYKTHNAVYKMQPAQRRWCHT